MAKATTTMKQALSYRAVHAAWFAATQALFNQVAAFYFEVIQAHPHVLHPDHVHLLVECGPQFGIHRLVRLIKSRSSRFLRQEFPKLKTRMPTLWTNSYFVSTVGGAPLSVIKQYIENQKHV